MLRSSNSTSRDRDGSESATVRTALQTARVKTLRKYQALDVQFIAQTNDHVCIEGPTGSGKTLTATAAAAILLREGGATGIVVGTPMEHVENGFTERDYTMISMPPGEAYASCLYQTPTSFVQAARENGKSGAAVTDYLGVDRDYVLACTHMALLMADLPKDLSNKILIVDEAHRAPIEGNRFAKFVEEWERRGGRLIFFTATPFRGDGEPVVRKGMRVRRRSPAQHMTELDTDGRSFAPSTLDISTVPLLQSGATVKQYQGEESPSAASSVRVAQAMVKEWKTAGKPPLMVRVPPATGSDIFVQRLLTEFRKQGARVVDASGVGTACKRRFIDVLRDDRNRHYRTRQVDVIVGIQRTLEGTDWPICSDIYVYGIPGSATAMIQLMGRATRKKEKDHPFADRVVMRFFVEMVNEETRATMQRTQAMDVLGIACLLGDLVSPSEWEVEKLFEEEIRKVAVDEQHQLDMLAEYGTARALEDDARARTGNEIAIWQLHKANPATTYGDAIDRAPGLVQELPNAPTAFAASEKLRRDLRKLLTEQTLQAGGAKAERARKLIQSIARRSLVNGFSISDLRQEVFTAVVEEFKKETLHIGHNITQAAQHVYQMTGETMQRYAQRVFNRTALSEAQIREWGDRYRKVHGQPPRGNSCDLGLPCGESWASIARALRDGGRGLPGGSSLAKFFDYDAPLHTVPQILAWARKCYKLRGVWPDTVTMRTGKPQYWGLPDPVKWGYLENWNAIDAALRVGVRGLPGGMTLRGLLIAHRLIVVKPEKATLSKKCVR